MLPPKFENPLDDELPVDELPTTEVDAAKFPKDDKVDEAEVPTDETHVHDALGKADGEKGGCDDTAETL